MRLLIIGGSDAGISAALRARELNDSAQIAVMLADSYPNFSVCGLPFYLSGETPDWRQLAHRIEFDGIELLKNTRATYIDVSNAAVLARYKGRSQAFPYDRLIIATGAVPTKPRIEGLGERGVFSLHTMEDSFRVHLFGMRVDELNDLDLSYTPPWGSPWDAVQMSAHTWSRAVRTQHFSYEVLNA